MGDWRPPILKWQCLPYKLWKFKIVKKKYIFGLYLSIICISKNIVLRNLWVLFQVLVFILCQKRGNFYTCLNFFLDFMENEPGPKLNKLRHNSLNSNVCKTYVKFHVWVMHNQ